MEKHLKNTLGEQPKNQKAKSAVQSEKIQSVSKIESTTIDNATAENAKIDNNVSSGKGEIVKSKSKAKRKYFTASRVSKIAIFAALTFALYMFPKFPLPFMPSFLEINFSDIPMLIGGFALGPIAGCIIVLLKCLFKLPFSSTAMVGEFADFLIGLAYVLPASLYYKKHHNLKGAVLSLSIGSLSSIVMAVFSNWLITIPFYVKTFFDGNWDILVNMCSVLGDVTRENFYGIYLFAGVVPFNLIRCLIASLLTLLLYKRISRFLHKW